MGINRLSLMIGLIVFLAPVINYPYEVTVYNDTPFYIKASCEKVGALPSDKVFVDINDKEKIKCGGADCIKGVHVTVEGSKSGFRDVQLDSSWVVRCQDISVHVLAIPQYNRVTDPKTGKTRSTITGFKFALAKDMDVSDYSEPFVCSYESK